MSQVHIYEDCQLDQWTSKISPDVNPSASDYFLPLATSDGLTVVNVASKEMGGGLISNNYAVPSFAKFFGMDITYFVSSADLPHLARNEMDMKITLKPGTPTPIPNQANGSAQQNASKGWMWQLDPTGSTWVDSGYAPGPPKPDAINTMQFRFWTDGTKWSVTGLRANGGDPFTPGSQFQNLPMITTNWGTGLHPQLQTEVQGAPFFLRQTYKKVRIIASDVAIPWDGIWGS